MLVYIGQTKGRRMRAILDTHGWGEMCVREEYPPKREPWAFDNGAFKDWRNGKPFDTRRYELALERLALDGRRPDFLVVPDIIAGGKASLDFSARWVESLRPLAPLYLVVQDGMEPDDVVPFLRPYAGIFVGGQLEWKLRTGAMWVEFAHSYGRACHIGRAGTPKRARWCRRIGVDSIDSALPLWSFAKMAAFVHAVNGDPHPELW
jgi:hypothetical protein